MGPQSANKDTRPMATHPVKACVAVGANLGNALATVRQSVRDLQELPDSRVLRVSSMYRTAPIDATGPDFVNAVVLMETRLAALDLLHALQSLELKAGRERPYVNAPRTLDLDVIFYGECELATPELTLPHPRWKERAFVVIPLAQVCPERVNKTLLAYVQYQAIERIEDQAAP